MKPTQKAPYLRNQRSFPFDNLKDLSLENDRAYIDISTKVNERTIGLFAMGNQMVTGESWYLSGGSNKQQTLRQVYMVTSTAPIPHGINIAQIDMFTRMYGQYTDGTNWYSLNPGTMAGVVDQITFYLDATNINFVVGAGAPALVKGNIVLEWLADF